MAPLPGCRGPLGGGGLPLSGGGGCGASVPVVGLRLSVGFRGRGGEGGRFAPGLPAVPPWSPCASRRWLQGGGLTVSAPASPVAVRSGGLAVGRRGGGEGRGAGLGFQGCVPGRGGTPGCWPALLSCPPSGNRASGRRAGLHPQPPLPSGLRHLLTWHRRVGKGGGRGVPGAVVWVSGQWLAVCGSVKLPSARPWSPPSPRPGAARVLLLSGLRGGWGGVSGLGDQACRGGVPRRWSAPTPPCHSPGVRGPACWAPDHCRWACPLPAPPLAWGLGPVGEGSAEGLGQPDVGLRVRDAEHRPPHHESSHAAGTGPRGAPLCGWGAGW